MKLNHNRAICHGDQRKNELPQESVRAIKRRMEKWSTAFLCKVLRENTNRNWQQAAQEMIHSRSHHRTP